MKSEAVVKRALRFCGDLNIDKFFRAFRETHKICHRLRRFFFKKTDDDISFGCFKYGVNAARTLSALTLMLFI